MIPYYFHIRDLVGFA